LDFRTNHGSHFAMRHVEVVCCIQIGDRMVDVRNCFLDKTPLVGGATCHIQGGL